MLTTLPALSFYWSLYKHIKLLRTYVRQTTYCYGKMRYGATMQYRGKYGTKKPGPLRPYTRYNAELHHYAFHGAVLHTVHAVPHSAT